MSEKQLLSIKDLSISYADKTAVNHANVSFEKNTITALIGPSGCGKSTFLKSINRMIDIVPSASYSGEIMYDGINILDKQIDVRALRKEIGMVFQNPNPFEKSILNNMTHALKFYKMRKKELQTIVRESLQKAVLWDEVSDRLQESALDLSGGQQQRLCIARTLAMKPSILLLDEPSSALDPIANRKVEELLIQLKEAYTIIIVTHNLQQAARISDKTAFFYNGEIVEFDETEKIFTNPSYKKTEEYITGRFG